MDATCNSSSPPVTTTRVRPPASTRRPSCRSSIAVFTISTLIEVTFSREHNPSIANDHTVEAIVHAKGPNLVARESAPTYEAAIDRLLDKLERQVERYRDKRTVEMRRRSQGGHAAAPAEEPLEFIPGESPRVARS